MSLKHSNKRGQLRIIGGEWRGRKLAFPDVDDLRPTADRVRETVFNWLQMRIPGARCLDLFAGSGALGLEALSRGASEVVFIEQDKSAAQQIRQHLNTLHCDRAHVLQEDAMQHLANPSSRFNVIFLDPPYRMDCLKECCVLLEENNWLKDEAFIYLEGSSKNPTPQLPDHWQLTHNKKAGEIAYYLACNSE